MVNDIIKITVIVIMGAEVLLSVLPIVPGIPIIFITMLIYAIFDGFQQITPYFLGIMFLISVFAFFIDYLVSWFGAKKYGGSKAGLWGAFFGGIIGFIIVYDNLKVPRGNN